MTPRTVRFHRLFQADLDRATEWAIEMGRAEWIDILMTGLAEVRDLLSRFPGAGSVQDRDGTYVIRKVLLRRSHHLAWSLQDEANRSGDVWLLRLFHAHEDRPLAKARQWRRRVW